MIVRSILQMLLVQAIKAGNTLAGQDRVFDALAGNIIKDEKHHCAPIAIVNADDTAFEAGLGVFRGRADQSFFIDLAVLYADKKAAQKEGREQWQLPFSDPGAQIYMSRLERGFFCSLLPSGSDAARLFYDGFGDELTGVKSLIGGNRKEGVRFAARQVQLTGRMFSEPAPNVAPVAWIDEALSFLEGVEETEREARILRLDLIGDPDAPVLAAELAQRKMSEQEAELLGVRDFAPDEAGFSWLPVDGFDPAGKVLD